MRPSRNRRPRGRKLITSLEVHGVIRSFGVRTTLDRELRVGESFDLRGRRWVVAKVDTVKKDDLDRRLVARELEEAV
jgi:hypothetical protein